jgi:hypothetical protein
MTDISVYSYVQPNGAKNFGDDMSLSMCEYASGKSLIRADQIYADMYGVGSLLQIFKSRKRQVKYTALRMLNGNKPLVLWGTGIIEGIPLYLPRVKVLALRGPYTAKALDIKTVVAFGDPGLLVSDILAAPAKSGKIGIVPHYVDKSHPVLTVAAKDDRFVIIDVEDNWENAVSHIAQCDLILSSSLHGLIVADAYGIPNQWLEFSNKVAGAGFKFRDYAEGVGRAAMKRVEVSGLEDIYRAVGMAKTTGASLGAAQLACLKNDLKGVLQAHYKDK